MTYYLFLDDERKPSDVTWVNIPRDRVYQVVRNYHEFVAMVSSYGVPAFVTFDHDLCEAHYGAMLDENIDTTFEYDDGDLTKTFNYGPVPTGFECAVWLVDYCKLKNEPFPVYTVHSMNPSGSKRITQYIESNRP